MGVSGVEWGLVLLCVCMWPGTRLLGWKGGLTEADAYPIHRAASRESGISCSCVSSTSPDGPAEVLRLIRQWQTRWDERYEGEKVVRDGSN